MVLYNATMARTDTPFGDWLYRFRMHLLMTQADFAAMVEVTLNTVQRWEYGTRVPGGPTRLLLASLAKQARFEEPPHVDTSRGPRERREG